ncbi:hypothetical protein [Tepidibacter hydrothermalis]|uniref:Uncharacterized protein n=1 Tax=Tepidibacter hydrothermalis TaxID=3036126 RepID=A0ABY8EB27_9FIRM|nr:hypothetical protein [Tepidibacter hydrothermalis]WFD08712.1 hypothetical protein P4S50_09905 [Tepidibacter hydrothermalis]
MSGYPIEIENFHNTILKLRGISTIESGVENLEPIDSELLKLSDFSHLPHASLLRTKGGLKDEVLIQFEFSTDYSLESFHSLEFIAWFVRDCARGGTKIQLRPFALPPVTPFGRQLGTTLRFHIDLFIDGIDETLEPAFKVINNLNKSINMFIDMYNIPLKD